MSKNPRTPEGRPEMVEPKTLTEEQVSSLVAQFRYMLLHEVKMMKLEVVESIGNMLARRSGFDKELHDLSARMEVLSKSVEGFAGRIAELEKTAEITVHGGPRGRARSLKDVAPAPEHDPPPPPAPAQPDPEKKEGPRRGRPKGSGYYSRMRMEAEAPDGK